MDCNENLHWCRYCGHNHFDNFRDFDVTRGQCLPFPIDFARGPYHSAALPRCLWSPNFYRLLPKTKLSLVTSLSSKYVRICCEEQSYLYFWQVKLFWDTITVNLKKILQKFWCMHTWHKSNIQDYVCCLFNNFFKAFDVIRDTLLSKHKALLLLF